MGKIWQAYRLLTYNHGGISPVQLLRGASTHILGVYRDASTSGETISQCWLCGLVTQLALYRVA